MRYDDEIRTSNAKDSQLSLPVEAQLCRQPVVESGCRYMRLYARLQIFIRARECLKNNPRVWPPNSRFILTNRVADVPDMRH